MFVPRKSQGLTYALLCQWSFRSHRGLKGALVGNGVGVVQSAHDVRVSLFFFENLLAIGKVVQLQDGAGERKDDKS